MKRFIKYPETEQFRTIVKDVVHSAKYEGKDADGNSIFNQTAKMPKLEAVATEKIHGTNASVCFSEPDGFWVQKRKSICTPEEDNAGCAFAAMQRKNEWISIIKDLADEYNINLDENIITVYYEWAGGNIQKNSACSNLDKMAIIFAHFKVSPLEPDEKIKSKWLPTVIQDAPVDCGEKGIYNILTFPTYKLEIDFSNPLMSQNKMIELVEKTIEPNSPVGKSLGVDGNIGEGVVFTFEFKNSLYRFKVKGEKHSASKVKTLEPVDEAELQKKQEIAQKVTPAWRLEQMFDEVNDTINGCQPDIKNLGKFIKMVMQDIIKEDSDIIADAGFEPKDMGKIVPQIIRPWYQEQLDTLYMK